VGDKATAKLLGAALGSSDDRGDVELGSGIAATFAPSWVSKSEKIKGEMGILKERMSKLKE
jgi:syntaxin 16